LKSSRVCFGPIGLVQVAALSLLASLVCVAPSHLHAQATPPVPTSRGTAGPAHDGVQNCWIDAKTGKPVRVVPVGTLNGFDQANAVESGHAFNPRTSKNYNLDGNGDWIDSATGALVNTVPVSILDGFDQANAVESGQAHNPRTGQNYVRIPCPPSTPPSTATPAPPSTTSPAWSFDLKPIINIPTGGAWGSYVPGGVGFYHKTAEYVSIHVGGLGRTTQYDDDFSIGTTSPWLTGTFGVAPHFSSSLRMEFEIGYQSPIAVPTAEREEAVTKLEGFGSFGVNIGAQLPRPLFNQPILLFGTFDGAIGVEKAGADTGSTSYFDTEKMFGFIVGGRALLPFSPHLAATVSVDYVHFPMTTFDSPGGDYKLGESGIKGAIGIEYRFHGPGQVPIK
jgi:hypothetical protein